MRMKGFFSAAASLGVDFAREVCYCIASVSIPQ